MSIFSMFEESAFYKRDDSGDYKEYDTSHMTGSKYIPIDGWEEFVMESMRDTREIGDYWRATDE